MNDVRGDADTVISVAGLSKRYGSTVAVDGVSFEVHRGEIFGLLGRNGAGKTTTVECLEGLRRADAGTLRVLGLDPGTQAVQLRRRIGCQLQESALPHTIKVWEALQWFASFTPHPVDWPDLLEQWGLADKRNAAVRAAVRRAAAAAVHRPGPGQRPAGRLPGRDDHRPGPGRPARRLGPRPPHPRPRHHRRAGHPLHGRGRAAVRPDRHHRPGPRRRPGHPARPGHPPHRPGHPAVQHPHRRPVLAAGAAPGRRPHPGR